ncbi:MAG: VOC family protein [Gammaproteobacteria bacterium]|nr:VOC family protein [Gammaproteobacteria bacterium]
MSDVSLVIFAKDQAELAKFYCDAIGFERIGGDDSHSALRYRGFDLLVHQIPASAQPAAERAGPTARRESSPLRIDIVVDSIERVAEAAAALGGRVDQSPPGWAPADARFRIGHDPEGNVIRISEGDAQ